MLNTSDGNTPSAPVNEPATSQQVDSNNTTTSSSIVQVDMDTSRKAKADVGDHIAGYIFMCNTGTKPDCFMYRVFGLPASRMKVVQKIKPNTKLFLYDFDVKLLYGLYVADTSGMLALEPNAFKGRFPAQVRFSIAKDCLPLPEADFKDVIKENYIGSKFKQELSDEQVNKLVSLFRPINVPSPPQPSLGFTDALRSLFQKHLEPSHQVTRYSHMHNERNVPEVPPVASASSYYGQNPMSHSSPGVAPSSSNLPSSSRVSQLVAVAARALNAEEHVHEPYNRSSIREVGYGHHDLVSPSSHEALSVSSRAMHTYDMNPYSRNATLPQTLASRSNGPSVDNTYLNYTSTDHPASINYGYAHNQGAPALPQIQPSLSQTLASGSNGPSVDNAYLNYNRNYPASINYGYAHNQGVSAMPQIQDNYNGPHTANLAYDYSNQGYYNSHQTVVGTSVHQSNNVPQVHQPYWSTTSGNMNQDYYNSNYNSGLPVAAVDATAGYAPVGVPRVYLT